MSLAEVVSLEEKLILGCRELW